MAFEVGGGRGNRRQKIPPQNRPEELFPTGTIRYATGRKWTRGLEWEAFRRNRRNQGEETMDCGIPILLAMDSYACVSSSVVKVPDSSFLSSVAARAAICL